MHGAQGSSELLKAPRSRQDLTDAQRSNRDNAATKATCHRLQRTCDDRSLQRFAASSDDLRLRHKHHSTFDLFLGLPLAHDFLPVGYQKQTCVSFNVPYILPHTGFCKIEPQSGRLRIKPNEAIFNPAKPPARRASATNVAKKKLRREGQRFHTSSVVPGQCSQ